MGLFQNNKGEWITTWPEELHPAPLRPVPTPGQLERALAEHRPIIRAEHTPEDPAVVEQRVYDAISDEFLGDDSVMHYEGKMRALVQVMIAAYENKKG